MFFDNFFFDFLSKILFFSNVFQIWNILIKKNWIKTAAFSKLRHLRTLMWTIIHWNSSSMVFGLSCISVLTCSKQFLLLCSIFAAPIPQFSSQISSRTHIFISYFTCFWKTFSNRFNFYFRYCLVFYIFITFVLSVRFSAMKSTHRVASESAEKNFKALEPEFSFWAPPLAAHLPLSKLS